jgi:signal transduction histidine kinase
MLGLKLVEEKLTSSNDQESLELIREMSASCSVAVDTLNDLLLYEKIEGDMFSLDLEEVSIGNVIKETVRLFRIQVESTYLNISFRSIS